MSAKDPTEPIRIRASEYREVDQGTACTQSSFKAGQKAFLYIGMQGGRYKAMFKLSDSIPQAEAMSAERPDDFDVGIGGWTTARFTAERPLPARLWKKWLDESYANATAGKKATAKKKATARKKR